MALPPRRRRSALAVLAAPAATSPAVPQTLRDGGGSITISASLSAAQGTVLLRDVCVLVICGALLMI